MNKTLSPDACDHCKQGIWTGYDHPECESNEHRAYRYAKANQGFDGRFADWLAMPQDERAEYEAGASGVPTA